MTDVFDGKQVYVSGKFDGLKKEEVWVYLLAAGAYGTMSKSAAGAYLSADPADPKLVATGKPIYTLTDLPAPLHGYIDRIEAAVALRRGDLAHYSHVGRVTHLGYGPPADDALIARIEAAVGPLPADVLTLMRQWNGLSCVLATIKKGQTVDLPNGAPLPYAALADMNHPLWKSEIDWLISTIAIPTWEDIFLRMQGNPLGDHGSSYGPKEVVQIGTLKVRAADLFPRLFAFDLFHHYGGAALYLDPKDGQAKIIYAFDHWADLTSAHPVPLRVYMESLIAGLWHRIAHAGLRPIRPTSKTAWPTYIRNIHRAPYVFIELK